MKDFENKNVFIPGGSSGIGLSTAKLLASEGSNILIFARTEKRLQEAVEKIESCRKNAAQKIAYMRLDVSDSASVKRTIKTAVEKFGVPDLVINCVGRAYPHYFEDITFEQFDETMHVNMYGVWNVCAELVPLMKEKGGTIVNISSLAGLMGVFGYTDYSASKFAIIGFSEALRSEMKQHNIDILVLCPPDTDTPGFRTENITKPEETKAVSGTARVKTADEVAKALVKGIRKNKPLIILGAGGKFSYAVKRLFPWAVEMVMDRDIRKAKKKNSAS